ncbi:MAG: hypothetical protein KAU22_05215 [Desulfuromonadales bacterium]|nr:hypothetical protein [Desulfuromonadales bacterium]
MFFIHPLIQVTATLLALYVLWLGVNRFRHLHLQQKTAFRWQLHVRLGTLVLLLWLVGMVVGLVVAKQNWHGILITGTHGNRLFLILPLILFSLVSGLYMEKRKRRRIMLPFIHGSSNILLVIMVLLQAISGWQVYKEFIRGY